MEKMVSILTVGSRGDVQPFLALGLGLQNAGFRVRIAANREHETLIRERGVDFVEIGPDPNLAFSKLVSNEKDTFRKNYVEIYTDWMRQWMLGGMAAAEDADIILVGPVASVGFDVAEKLGKPCIQLDYMPTRPTREFPNSSLSIKHSLGGFINKQSTAIVEEVSWWASRKIFNRLRQGTLNLPPHSGLASPQRRLRQRRIPVLGGWSQHVVAKPADWPEWVHVTGYWFLNSMEDWHPPASLVDFLIAGPPPIYFELGSLTVLVQETIRNVLRGLVSIGCRTIANPRDTDLSGIQLSDKVFLTNESVPHSWILPRVRAAIVHGGPSTVAAVFRAGIPFQVLPIFRGHAFWGHRAKQLGVGLEPISSEKVRVPQITRAACRLLEDQSMRRKASELGERIREEDGVGRAVKVVQSLVT